MMKAKILKESKDVFVEECSWGSAKQDQRPSHHSLKYKWLYGEMLANYYRIEANASSQEVVFLEPSKLLKVVEFTFLKTSFEQK